MNKTQLGSQQLGVLGQAPLGGKWQLQSIWACAFSGVLGAASMAVAQTAVAQTAPAPAANASDPNVSEAVRRQAASPYRWIIQNANNAQKAKSPAPAPAAAAPAAAPSPASASPATANPAPAAGNSATAVAAAAARRQELADAAAREAAAKEAAARAPAPVPVVAAAPPPPPPPPAPAPVAAPAPAPVVVAAVAPPPPPKLNTELVVIDQPEPRLSPQLRRELTQDYTIRVEFVVNPNGSTSDVKVLASSSPRGLSNAVAAAVREWKYKPIDIPVKSSMELVFTQ